MKIRNQRTGRLIELPDDDGMIRNRSGLLITPEKRQAVSRLYIGDHDNQSAKDRWLNNYWGIYWKEKQRAGWQLAKTDPQSWQEFVAAELGL